ncbi:MAG: sodium-dependent transporter [Cellvibrionaceae bacterium]
MTEAPQKVHGVWASRWTFILAATGSAVGLGNIWKFPYITGEYGGGAFVLVYLFCIALVGVPIMVAEVLLGRRGRSSPINTMRRLVAEANMGRGWTGIGWLGVTAGFLILTFYSVIAGWALYYAIESMQGNLLNITAETASSSFDTLLANKNMLITYHSIFMLMVIGVVTCGVVKGLGVAVRVLMPLLFILLLVLLGYGVQEGNFPRAVDFLFGFDFSKLSGSAILVALGHAFFTLSLGMGAIMAYGAYMPEQAKVGQTVVTVAFLDTLIALVAGLAIFPVVFAHPGIEPSAGPGLMFVSLPVAFGNMPGGLIFGTAFFVLVVLAAWSSAISLIEPAVAWLVESRNFSRLGASLLLGFTAWFIGLGTVLSFNAWAEFKVFFGMTFFDFLDYLTANIMLPLGGLFIAIFVGWIMKKENVMEELKGTHDGLLNHWYKILRYVAPVLVALVFLNLVVGF